MKQAAKILCGVFFLLVFAPVTQAQALSDGVYTAAVETYYLNPDTGETDDGGSKNAAIGEGMCRSAVFETALVEVENGKTYVTIRMLLASNVKNTTFTVQQTSGDASSYQSVSTSMMAEDATSDSRDYRFEVPSASSYIGCSMYVTPMGRDVKFYMQVQESGATSGGGNFVVSISQTSAAPATTSSDSASASTNSNSASSSQSTQKAAQSSSTAAAASTQTASAAQSSTTTTSDAPSTQSSTAEGDSTDGAENAAQGDENPDSTEAEDEAALDEDADHATQASREARGSNISVVEKTEEEGLSTTAKVLIACAIVLLAAGGAGGYVYYMKKKAKAVTQTGGDTK